MLVGDPPAVNPQVPGYGAFAGQFGRAPDRTGATVSTQLLRAGETGETRHNIPGVFWDYLHQQWPIWTGARYETGPVVDWLFAFGYPVSEPYWVRASVAGAEQWVLVQAFERRVLTWTPANPSAYRVEMGNVGQHYHRWRYGWSW